MTIKPLADRIVIKMIEAEEKTKRAVLFLQVLQKEKNRRLRKLLR